MPTLTTTDYYTVNGQIIGEKVGSNPRTDYLTDAVGSVTATVDQNAQLVNTYRYKPYGAQLSKTGTGADPAFRWVGSLGYRQTGLNQSDVYVRARHYGTAMGRWAAKDRIGELLSAYAYSGGDPAAVVDPSGLFGIKPATKPCVLGHCGKGSCEWDFDMDAEIKAKTSGAIIQRVVVTANYADCPGGKQHVELLDDFWEAWPFVNGKKTQDPCYKIAWQMDLHDTFSSTPKDPSCGVDVTAIGIAYLVENYKFTRWDPQGLTGWACPGDPAGNKESGNPTMKTQPPDANLGGPAALHIMLVEGWECCPPDPVKDGSCTCDP